MTRATELPVFQRSASRAAPIPGDCSHSNLKGSRHVSPLAPARRRLCDPDLFVAVLILAAAVPGYSHVRQTVSEIGMQGSPVATPFTIAFLLTAGLLLLFAAGLYTYATHTGASTLPAYFVAAFGLALTGLALFPSPNPWHNRFGLSLTVGYLSPAVVAIAWRRAAGLADLVRISWVAFGLVVAAIALNLLPAFLPVGAAYQEHYGLVQRALWVAFLGWCSWTSVVLYRRSGSLA
ncbi:MAG: DUF998 domain-containing protein [Gemmatimonadota bacterium]